MLLTRIDIDSRIIEEDLVLSADIEWLQPGTIVELFPDNDSTYRYFKFY